MQPIDRLREAKKQTQHAYDDLDEADVEAAPGLVDEVGTIAEQLRRVIHGLEDSDDEGVSR